MADIKLKNRSGTDVTYTGVKTIQVPKADGTKEDFINPQGNINITDTQITDVRGKATAQVVDANLKAENIAKDVSILGITGTHEGGGGGGGENWYPMIFDVTNAKSSYVSSMQWYSLSDSCKIPKGAVVKSWGYLFDTSKPGSKTSFYPMCASYSTDVSDLTIDTSNEGYDVITVTKTNAIIVDPGAVLQRTFYRITIPFIKVKQVDGYSYDAIIEYSTMGNFPFIYIGVLAPQQFRNVTVESGYTDIAVLDRLLERHRYVKKIVLPSTVSTMPHYLLTYQKQFELLDCRALAQVPTLAAAFTNPNTTYKIVVPDNLYDTWITAQYWSSVASHIVKASEYVEE